jgi:hypothetical protein
LPKRLQHSIWSAGLWRKAFLLSQIRRPQIENRKATDRIKLHHWYRHAELQKKKRPPSQIVFLCFLHIHQCDASLCYQAAKLLVIFSAFGTNHNTSST